MNRKNKEKMESNPCYVCKTGGNVLECSRCNRFCHPTCKVESQTRFKPYRSVRNSKKWWCSECRLRDIQQKGLRKLTNHAMLAKWISNRDKLQQHFSSHIRENMSFKCLSKVLNPPVQFPGFSGFQCPSEFIGQYVGIQQDPPQKKNPRNCDKKRLRVIQASNSARSEESRLFCHYCNQNCSKGPMILCDLCHVPFHLDCVDGGVSSKRSETWMCPLHADHVVSKLCPTKSLTTRIALINKHCKSPIDEEAVATRYMSRRKLAVPQTITVPQNKVPEVVKHLYEESKRSISANICGLKSPKSNGMEDDPWIRSQQHVEMVANSPLEGIENVISSSSRAYLLFFQDPHSLARFYPIEEDISIGTDGDCDVRLDKLCPPCARASPLHARIFHDRMSDNYELLNYSQFGTLVDRVVYYNRAVVARGSAGGCSCLPIYDLEGEGNEEAAVLVHGSEIYIGCIKFIVAIY